MVTTPRQRQMARLLRRLEELRAWRNQVETDIPTWTFALPDGREFQLRPGDFWPEVTLPVRFESSLEVPAEWVGQPVEAELWLGGEGFVQISTGFRGGLNPMHHRFPVTSSAAGGETITIEAEVVPKGIFGSHIAEPRIERSMLVIPNLDVRALERDLTMVHDACAVLDQHEVVPFLLEAAEQALSELAADWPTATPISVSRYVHGYESGIGASTAALPSDWHGIDSHDNRRPTMPIWQMPDSEPMRPLPEPAIEAVRRARALLAGRLDTIRQDYPPVGRLCLTGHAHTDLAWLWPLAETRRKLRRTWWTVIDLMDRYPDFTFDQSSAQAYAWMEADDPELFARVRERVREGRWEPVGGTWVEPDANITGGESFVRQLFYGQRYFESTFGARHSVIWLPDVFGYSGALPQILRGAGISGFFTIKLNWNESNTFPYDLFTWEGIDGASVTAHMFANPGHGYNGNIVPFDTLGTWRNFRGKTRHNESLLSFGWGDGAGGPSERMLENYARIRDFPALPRLRMGLVEEFFHGIPSEGLPKVVGELYLELHRGTLTTQAKTKRLMRQGEHRLFEAEVFASIASLDGHAYPADDLEHHWKTLLLNQFHDILPGSSITEVYGDAHQQLEEVTEAATTLRNQALATGNEPIVANAGLYPRPLTIFVAEASSLPAENAVRQDIEGGVLICAPGVSVPALGSVSLQAITSAAIRMAAATGSESGGSFVLENHLLRVSIGADGTIDQIFDKEAERVVLTDRGNQLCAYVDKPYAWDAWDIDETYARDGEEIIEVESVELIESGPIRASVRVERQWRDSTITQTYRLWNDSKRLDIATDIDWHERQVLLKTHFPLAVRSDHAAFETMYGAVTRPTHRNSPWDAARFEGCGHRFGDLSEPGYGVALLNDGKYGYEALGSDLMLSLLRSPLYPDPLADEGEHRFTYSLLPHIGDWTESDVVQQAFALNSPLIVTTGTPRPSFVTVDGIALGIGALKRAENGNGLILRLYEPHGARGVAELHFDQPLASATFVDLLEDDLETEAASESTGGPGILLDFRPFEIKSLRIVLA